MHASVMAMADAVSDALRANAVRLTGDCAFAARDGGPSELRVMRTTPSNGCVRGVGVSVYRCIDVGAQKR
ncbi:hypothetical protein PT2222_70297 [Paraburkholderia tropica]